MSDSDFDTGRPVRKKRRKKILRNPIIKNNPVIRPSKISHVELTLNRVWGESDCEEALKRRRATFSLSSNIQCDAAIDTVTKKLGEMHAWSTSLVLLEKPRQIEATSPCFASPPSLTVISSSFDAVQLQCVELGHPVALYETAHDLGDIMARMLVISGKQMRNKKIEPTDTMRKGQRGRRLDVRGTKLSMDDRMVDVVRTMPRLSSKQRGSAVLSRFASLRMMANATSDQLSEALSPYTRRTAVESGGILKDFFS